MGDSHILAFYHKLWWIQGVTFPLFIPFIYSSFPLVERHSLHFATHKNRINVDRNCSLVWVQYCIDLCTNISIICNYQNVYNLTTHKFHECLISSIGNINIFAVSRQCIQLCATSAYNFNYIYFRSYESIIRAVFYNLKLRLPKLQIILSKDLLSAEKKILL